MPGGRGVIPGKYPRCPAPLGPVVLLTAAASAMKVTTAELNKYISSGERGTARRAPALPAAQPSFASHGAPPPSPLNLFQPLYRSLVFTAAGWSSTVCRTLSPAR